VDEREFIVCGAAAGEMQKAIAKAGLLERIENSGVAGRLFGMAGAWIVKANAIVGS
jgi:hypothetical protein